MGTFCPEDPESSSAHKVGLNVKICRMHGEEVLTPTSVLLCVRADVFSGLPVLI